MSDSINVPENWKTILRDDMLTAMVGSPQEQIEANTRLHYAFNFYAPASLYMYYKPRERNLRTVAENKLWFSAAAKFNDVFDADLLIDREAVLNSLLTQFTGDDGIRSGSPAWNRAHAEMVQQEKQFSNLFEQFRETTGIVCFSESCSSTLMWSHYAQNHQGFCVEYNVLDICSKVQSAPVPVIYSSERVCLTSINPANIRHDALYFLGKGLTTKANEWSYENEWRLIREKEAFGAAWDDEKQGALLPSITPKAIILGCEVCKEFEEEVQRYCEESKVNLFKMEKDRAKYQLNKKQILIF